MRGDISNPIKTSVVSNYCDVIIISWHCIAILQFTSHITDYSAIWRGGGLGSRPKKMYGERMGDGVEYHLMKPTPRR